MSGEVYRTPDLVLSDDESVDNAKLNRVGGGTFQVGAGAITDRELSVSVSGSGAFNTVSALRANSSSFNNGDKVEVKGYYDKTDGGFGPSLIVDSTDTTTSDDGLSCFVDTNGLRFKREFTTPINVRWAGAKGTETYGGPYTNDDTNAFEETIETAAETGNTVFVPAGVYRWTRPFKKVGANSLPFVERFEIVGASDAKHHQLIESWGYTGREQTVIVIDLATPGSLDTNFAFDCVDTTSDWSSKAEQYGPYVIENIIFKCESGSGFRYGGLTTSGTYDADDPLEPFVHGVRFRNCYATGKSYNSWMDGSNELLNIQTNQKFLEIAKGFECELDNVALRGFYIQVDAHLCDNFLFNRIRSSLGFINIRSNSNVPSQVQNLQVEGKSFLTGLVANNTRINSSRFENGYSGDIGKFQASEGATDVNWSVTAAAQYIDLTNLSGNQPSDYFHEHMVVELVDSSSNSYFAYITNVDDNNNRLSFQNYDGSSRFHTTTSGTEINRFWGYHFVCFGESAAVDVSLAFNEVPSPALPNHFVVPGPVPIPFSGVTGEYGSGNINANRGRVVAHTGGKQFRMNGTLDLDGCSGFLCEEPNHPYVSTTQLVESDNPNKRGMPNTDGPAQSKEWFFSPQQGYGVADNGQYNYIKKIDDYWVFEKQIAANHITFDGGYIPIPSGEAVYEISVMARAITGTQQLQIEATASDPSGGTNCFDEVLTTNWQLITRTFKAPLTNGWGAGTSSSVNTLRAKNSGYYLAWIRLKQLNEFSDKTKEYTLQARTGSADLTDNTSSSITAFADAGGGQVTVTVSAAVDGLQENDYIGISGTTNYNGTFQVTNLAADGLTFEITDTWVSDDATGTVHANVFDVVETSATYDVDYNSTSYVDGDDIYVVAADDTATITTGDGRLLNKKRFFTPPGSGYFGYETTNLGAYYTTGLYRVILKGSEWTLDEVWRNERSATLTVTPTITLGTGEIELGVNSWGVSSSIKLTCKQYFSHSREVVEGYLNSEI